MLSIWKFELHIGRDQIVEMPEGSLPMTVQYQSSQLCLWALVNPKARKVKRGITMYGTGHEIDPRCVGEYIATIQQGPFVWHFFDMGER
jgi:hypothetical protein